ncbi:hypothetical protein JOL79_20115 [Microbispora sp. RL4-1S]|uniref:Uncharacterized protein n=1 Tax=Microbispora oryzae TaxID=2806554 RepID=A0A940WJI0_9ACTN|nr:hypothetical protein [Microbispora oryzae]MBP2706118.1 hypothetical protein [Microbispora oryzae]
MPDHRLPYPTDLTDQEWAMNRRALVCWLGAILLSTVPNWALLPVDTKIYICAYMDTEGGYSGRDVLGLGFGAMAALLPFTLIVLAVAAWRSLPQRRRHLAWIGAGGAFATAAYHALSTVAFFSPYCPEGSQGPGFVFLLYGAVAALVLTAGAIGAGDKPNADAETRS